MADNNNDRLNNPGSASGDLLGGKDPLTDVVTTGNDLPGTLPGDDLLGDDTLDSEDALLAEADLFDDEDDLVSLDELEADDEDDVTGQDDDNPYGESDEALPDDTEERAIARENARSGDEFDET